MSPVFCDHLGNIKPKLGLRTCCPGEDGKWMRRGRGTGRRAASSTRRGGRWRRRWSWSPDLGKVFVICSFFICLFLYLLFLYLSFPFLFFLICLFLFSSFIYSSFICFFVCPFFICLFLLVSFSLFAFFYLPGQDDRRGGG